MAEYDRLYTLRTDTTDQQVPEVTYLNQIFRSASGATIEGMRLFSVDGIGKHPDGELYFFGLKEDGTEIVLNDVSFQSGVSEISTACIIRETQHFIEGGRFVTEPPFAPTSSVHESFRFSIYPPLTAVIDDGELCEFIAPNSIEDSIEIEESKIWVRKLEESANETVATITDNAGQPIRDVKIRQYFLRVATRWRDIAWPEYLIVDDDGVAWDITNSEELGGRRKDVFLNLAREEQVI